MLLNTSTRIRLVIFNFRLTFLEPDALILTILTLALQNFSSSVMQNSDFK